MDSKEVLLVSSKAASGLEVQLLNAGWHITRVDQGRVALTETKHKAINTAILISTEGEMDLAETALNLHDINPSVEIIMIVKSHRDSEAQSLTRLMAHAIPKSKVLTVSELTQYLRSPELNVQS